MLWEYCQHCHVGIGFQFDKCYVELTLLSIDCVVLASAMSEYSW